MKNKYLPKFIILFYTLTVLSVGIRFIVLWIIFSGINEANIKNFLDESFNNLTIVIMTTGVWIVYFLRSKRVKNTFIK